MPRAICCKASLRRCKGGASAKAARSDGASRRLEEKPPYGRAAVLAARRDRPGLCGIAAARAVFSFGYVLLYENDRPPIMAYRSLRQDGPMRLSATLPLSMSRALFRRPEQRFLLEPIRYLLFGPLWRVARCGPVGGRRRVCAASGLAVFAWLPFFPFFRRTDSVSEGAKRENLSCDKRPAMRTVCHRAFYIILLYHILFKRFRRF